jgi:hypothetical protein
MTRSTIIKNWIGNGTRQNPEYWPPAIQREHNRLERLQRSAARKILNPLSLLKPRAKEQLREFLHREFPAHNAFFRRTKTGVSIELRPKVKLGDRWSLEVTPGLLNLQRGALGTGAVITTGSMSEIQSAILAMRDRITKVGYGAASSFG